MENKEIEWTLSQQLNDIMKKKRYDQQGNCINCNAEYDEMSERLEFKGEPKYKKPIDLKMLVYLIISCILILLLVNIQSCN